MLPRKGIPRIPKGHVAEESVTLGASVGRTFHPQHMNRTNQDHTTVGGPDPTQLFASLLLPAAAALVLPVRSVRSFAFVPAQQQPF